MLDKIISSNEKVLEKDIITKYKNAEIKKNEDEVKEEKKMIKISDKFSLPTTPKGLDL